MTPWATGRADVDDLVERGHLEKVAPSAANADRLIGEEHRGLHAAFAGISSSADVMFGIVATRAGSKNAWAETLSAITT